jgi:predicted transcriptional regulator
MSKTHLTERINLWLDAELLHSLEDLASRGDRTIAAEMRRALRAHVESTHQQLANLTSAEHVALLTQTGSTQT